MLKRINNLSNRIKGTKHYTAEFICDCGNIIRKRIDSRAKTCGCKSGKKPYIQDDRYKVVVANNEYIYEHRFVIEKHIKRKLKNKEQIHHQDGNKLNNKLSNLILCEDAKEHNRYNKGWVKKKKEWYKVCPKCKILKKLEGNFYKCKKQFFYICIKCKNNIC